MSPRSIALLLVGGLAGCGDPKPDPLPRQTVMIIDDGFDPSLPLFQGRIAAAYTLTCRPDPLRPDGGAQDGGQEGGQEGGQDGGRDASDGGDTPDGGAIADAGPTLEESKAALLASLAEPDDSCHLTPGIGAKENPFADLEGDRLRWNEALRGDVLVTSGTLGKILETLGKRLESTKLSFHGTATAGIIAHQTSGVQLVLVERPLGDPQTVATDFSCFTQEEIDRTVALFSSPEVRQAYAGRPMATADRELSEVMTAHGVQLVNESYGRLSRFAVEGLLDRKRCAPVALKDYFALMNELDRTYEDAHPGPALVIKAAGNDGALTRGPGDSVDCRIGDLHRLTIGSYGFNYQRSKFTNFGACVDAYAPGELVIGPLPGDWLFPLSGTSFSAPLVTRLVASTPGPSFDPQAARQSVLAQRALNGDLPVGQFPPALLYHPNPPGGAGQALTVGPTPRLPRLWLPSEPVLGKALWPIRWVARHR
jgi:hypothetical protein